VLAHERSLDQSQQMVDQKYFGRERISGRVLEETSVEEKTRFNPDSLFERLNTREKARSLEFAYDKARSQKDQIEYNALMLDEYKRYVRKHEVELHRKFTLAFACLIFFFIGAPLGAIIRKGGLGAPVVISVVMFIIYYIIDNAGYKMAREAIWPCWLGMWLSSFVLLPIGVFLTYKAATDSALFNPEAWLKGYNDIKKKIQTEYEHYTRSFKRLSRRQVRDSRG
jgi:lipopolysaccharide export system permease protein